jgi:hypothetical protein
MLVQLSWISFACVRLVRGLRGLKSQKAQARFDIAFAASVFATLGLLYVKAIYFPRS